jgi:hypothetical protein
MARPMTGYVKCTQRGEYGSVNRPSAAAQDRVVMRRRPSCETAPNRDPAPVPVTTLIRRESAEHGVPIGADRDPTKTLIMGIKST